MEQGEEVKRRVLAALERDQRVDLHRHPVRLDYADGILTMEGDVGGIAAKKIALELAASVPGVTGIVDRLRVTASSVMGDGEIRDHTCNALLQESSFNDFGVRGMARDAWETFKEPSPDVPGYIDVEVVDGTVVLNGRVGSLSHKRLAGVIAWWVPGSRDVVNGLEIEPPEDDNVDEIRDAVLLALEKDPFVNASQISIHCRDNEVTLEGIVAKPLEREMAEADAWYVFGVEKVINLLQVAE